MNFENQQPEDRHKKFRDTRGDPLRGKKIEGTEMPFYDTVLKKLTTEIEMLSMQINASVLTNEQKVLIARDYPEADFLANLTSAKKDYEALGHTLKAMLVETVISSNLNSAKKYVETVEEYIKATRNLVDLNSIHGYIGSDVLHKKELMEFVKNLEMVKNAVATVAKQYEQPELN